MVNKFYIQVGAYITIVNYMFHVFKHSILLVFCIYTYILQERFLSQDGPPGGILNIEFIHYGYAMFGCLIQSAYIIYIIYINYSHLKHI